MIEPNWLVKKWIDLKWWWFERRVKKGATAKIDCEPVCCPPEETANLIVTPIPPWEEINFTPGPQGRALCEGLGLDPKTVLSDPITFLRNKDKVYINYTGCATVSADQFDEALRLAEVALEVKG